MLSGQFLRVFTSSFVWLLLSCSLSYGTESDIACLKSIKASLQDPNNYLSSSWNFDNTTEGYICKFMGIDCWHPDENRVLNIRLGDLGLKGEFPVGIRNCTSVTGIDFSNNDLHGQLPNNISHIIGFATMLDLSFNNFSGNIPPEIANCTYLNSLKLDHNRFSGQIPPQISLLGRLRTFSVANNLLTGPVPSFFNATISADSYANNLGLCGKPLDDCQGSSKSTTHAGVIAGAAIGGVTVAAIGVGIGLLFYYRKAAVMRKKKKKDDDPDGNKWAKSIKGAKAIKVSDMETSVSSNERFLLHLSGTSSRFCFYVLFTDLILIDSNY